MVPASSQHLLLTGVRQGFRVLSFDGREWRIAPVDLAKRYRVGKYGVDVAAMEAAAQALLITKPRRLSDLGCSTAAPENRPIVSIVFVK